MSHLPGRTETAPERIAERQREKEVVKRRLAALAGESDPIRAFIEQNVALFNGKPGEPASFDLLDKLLDAQAYRLSFWRVASDEINYRRFFDINELAALSMERPEVFEATHELIFRLLREGKIDGLRIDHPDGLFDPQAVSRTAAAARRPGAGEKGLRFAGRRRRAPPWEEVRDRILARLEKSARKVRCGGRCTSWWRRSSGRPSRCRRTGRSTGRAATSSSTWSTTCSWTRRTRSRSRPCITTGARSIRSSR